MMRASDQYQLLDVGDGARLERFGERIVDRPHPAAIGARGHPEAWRHADLRFDRDGGWTGSVEDNVPWPCAVGGIVLELRPTEAGQVGLFPEHLAMLPWLRARVAERLADTNRPDEQPPAVLNLFAYTGLTTLALAASGAAVTHLDSSRPTVAWARHNAARSDLTDRPIRWIVDDAVAFTRRELRRGRHYDGLVLDPPSYGHGPAGQAWRIEDDLVALLDSTQELLRPNAFVLLTAHSPGFDGDRLATTLTTVINRGPGTVERGNLRVSTEDDRRLELGAFARWAAGAS
jgi:23S rRNA (cytosine1962-C5)-methyltransferase